MSPVPNPPAENLAFQPVTPFDAELLAVMHERCFAPGERWNKPALQGTLMLATTKGWIAHEDGAPAGFVLLQLLPPECEVLTFCMLPEKRRRGWGRQCLAMALESAQQAGCRHVTLEVAEDNRAALALYRQLGFAENGRREGYYGAPGDARKTALILTLSLEARGNRAPAI